MLENIPSAKQCSMACLECGCKVLTNTKKLLKLNSQLKFGLDTEMHEQKRLENTNSQSLI